MTNNHQIIYIGLDISKAKVDIYLPWVDSYMVIENNPKGIKKLLKKCQGLNTHFVMEATGGYERTAKTVLMKAGHTISVLNAKRVRDFARSQGHLAKTDKIDSKVISEYAAYVEPAAQVEMDELHEALVCLDVRRNQLSKMRVQEKNRLEKAYHKTTKNSIKRSIKRLEKELALIEKDAQQLIEQAPSLKRKAELLLSVKGVGEKTTIALLAMLPELGKLNSKQIAALTGLAPFNVDSGQMRGKRKIYGGRRAVRNSLYMATLVAIRYNPIIKIFYERLLAKGKQKMVCISACSRKLICIMNAMLRDDQPWTNPLSTQAS